MRIAIQQHVGARVSVLCQYEEGHVRLASLQRDVLARHQPGRAARTTQSRRVSPELVLRCYG